MNTISDLLSYIEEAKKLCDRLYEENGQGNDVAIADIFYQLTEKLKSVTDLLNNDYHTHRIAGDVRLAWIIKHQSSYAEAVKSALEILRNNYDDRIKDLELHRNELNSFIEALENMRDDKSYDT